MKKTFSKGKVLFCSALASALLLSGCGNSDNFVFTNTVVTAPPVAQNDAYNALGNATVTYTAANGVLTNDTPNGGSISSFDAVGSQGGAIVLNADGSFSYTPVFGFVGAETFTYTLSNADGTSTATVTMTSTGEGFFVDNTVAPGGDGSQASPFNTLAAAEAAAGSGDTIFVARGDGTNTGLNTAITLATGVNLIGEGQGLILTQTIVAPGLAPVLTGPITCNGSNTISGITLDGGAAVVTGVTINGAGDVTISNNTFRDCTESYVFLNNATGTNTIDNNQFDPAPLNTNCVDFNSMSANCSLAVTNNTFDDDNVVNPVESAVDLDISGTSVVSFTFTGNAINGSNDGNSFLDGLQVTTMGTSSCSFNIDSNTITGTDDDGLDFDAVDAATTLGGTLTGNTITNVVDYGVDFDNLNGGTTTISNNVIDATGTFGMYLSFISSGTYVVTNNTVTNAGDDGIVYQDSELTGTAGLALRNNTVTDAVNQSLEVSIQNDASVCCDVTGNVVNTNMLFDDTSTGTLDVEDFGNIMTINTFNAGATAVDSGVNPVLDGACAIP